MKTRFYYGERHKTSSRCPNRTNWRLPSNLKALLWSAASVRKSFAVFDLPSRIWSWWLSLQAPSSVHGQGKLGKKGPFVSCLQSISHATDDHVDQMFCFLKISLRFRSTGKMHGLTHTILLCLPMFFEMTRNTQKPGSKRCKKMPPNIPEKIKTSVL